MTTIFKILKKVPEYKKDMKRVGKKFKTIESDLDNFIKTELKLYHKLGKNVRGIVRIPNLGFINPPIYKARKFACRSLKGTGSRSGVRVIYTYFEKEDKLELIEIYYKGYKEIEDRERIKKHYTN